MNNLFETAVRRKYRFPLNGQLTVEDIWDIPLESLDRIFKTLNAQRKQVAEESLLAAKSREDEDLINKIEIVKHIVATKVAEKEARDAARARKEQKQKIMAIIDEKKDNALRSMTTEQLEALLHGMEE